VLLGYGIIIVIISIVIIIIVIIIIIIIIIIVIILIVSLQDPTAGCGPPSYYAIVVWRLPSQSSLILLLS